MDQDTTSLETNYGSSSRSTVRDRVTYLLIGGGIGAVVALLFAPKPGREFRSNIAEVTRTGIDTTLEKARSLQEQSTEIVQNVKEKASSWYDFAAAKLSTGGKVASDVEIAVGNLSSEVDTLESSTSGFGSRSNIGPFQTDDQDGQKTRTTGRKPSSIV